MSQESLSKRCLTLFFTFFKIGAFTFGGGYAMIPLIQRETVENHHWVTDQDILDMLAIAESTPGVIAVNSATFVGYRVAGFWGSLCATVGVVLPSFIVILIISSFIEQFKSFKYVEYAFVGIRAGVVVLILNAVFKLAKQCPKAPMTYILSGLSFLLVAFLGISVIPVLIAAALIGITASIIAAKRKKGGEL